MGGACNGDTVRKINKGSVSLIKIKFVGSGFLICKKEIRIGIPVKIRYGDILRITTSI